MRSREIISAELYNAFIIVSTLSVFISIGAFPYFIRYYPPDKTEEEMSDEAKEQISSEGE